MITIVKAPGFLTVQDLGWETGRAWGLPRSGAMDPVALQVANLLVGNPRGLAALEWALVPGTLRLERAATLALAGAGAEVLLDEQPARLYATLHAEAGQALRVRQITGGRFLYLAVRGGIAVPAVLGSRSTYLPAQLGGLEGRRLRSGDVLPLGPDPDRSPPPRGFRLTAPPLAGEGPVAVIEGPQRALFAPDALERLCTEPYTVSPASDRMGTRLAGPALAVRTPAALPSEAACPGAIQVPDSGLPIVLMPDGPTVGGYPKLAAVTGADLPRLAQVPLGAAVRFRLVNLADARAALRRERQRLDQLEQAVRLVEA